MKTKRQKAYEKLHNIWRRNVKRKINFGLRVPDFKVPPIVKGKTYLENPTFLKDNWISKLMAFIKRLFHYGNR